MSLTSIARIWREVMGANRLSPTEIKAVTEIIAARDAQWIESIGKPVAWSYINSKGWKMADFSGPHDLFESSPLYAIKGPALKLRVDLKTLADDLAKSPEDLDVCGKYVPVPEKKP